ncbi:MAG: hydroxyacylglutathione hydrolase [Methylophilaceae bacterium]
MLEILPIPAFHDNYIWLLRSGNHAVVVDPGDAAPVISALEHLSLKLDAILITHHHSDHIGGVAVLLQRWPAKVYAPKREQYSFPHQAVEENSIVHLETLNLDLTVMEVPGHTLGHVAYYGANYLFCGDTLFGAGCGRLFEGTPEQMYNSLQRLAKLPENTAVYCTHEYTEHNLSFARTLDSGNPALSTRQAKAAATRLAGKPTLPSSIGLELETNPFLRCETKAIQLASGVKSANPIEVFAAIREMRNHY